MRIASGPPSLWRYGALLPVQTPAEPRLAPGFTPLVEAPRLAEALGLRELYLKLDTANPTHSFKDRVVAVACAKAQELGLTTLACSSTGNLSRRPTSRFAEERGGCRWHPPFVPRRSGGCGPQAVCRLTALDLPRWSFSRS